MDTPIIVTVIGMVIASVGAAITSITGYLSNRDKLKYDAERVKLFQDVASLKRREEVCQRDIAQLQEDRENFRGQVAKLQTQMERDTHETQELRRELRELRDVKDRGRYRHDDLHEK